MVRFTLKDVIGSVSMKLELDPGDPVSEVSCIAREYWGSEGFNLCKGYGRFFARAQNSVYKLLPIVLLAFSVLFYNNYRN